MGNVQEATNTAVYPRPSGPKTKMIPWRGGEIEFCRDEGCGFNSTTIADPPWYVVRYRGMYWDRKQWNYDWIDYGGPPKMFLTRKRAMCSAIAFRKQYGGKPYGSCGPLEVEVVKLQPIK
jgi:hypothetical protein